MKSKFLYILVAAMILITSLSGCKGTSRDLTTIKLNEATHSVFYAPFYVAMEKGYFSEEGIKIILINGSGSDHSMKALLNGDCNIGLLGPETSIYAFNGGTKDYVLDFGQLTQRAGNFLISKDRNEEFSWDNIKGKKVIGGRADSMPEMVFEYILKKQGIDPNTELTIIKDIEFGKTADAFIKGKGDYILEFEPTASRIVKDGAGKEVTSLGEDSGKVPYTVFAARKSYITKNPKLIQSFTNAVQKGLDYVRAHSPQETAKVIQPQFTETDNDTLTRILTKYYDQDTWKDNLIFEEGSLTLLQDIMLDAGQLSARVPYDDIVNTEFAQKASK